MEPCPHGDHPLACLDCLETGNVPARDDTLIVCARGDDSYHRAPIAAGTVVVSPPFKAKYAGTCPRCGDDWNRGELIVKISDDRYIHHGCSLDMEVELKG